jgi:hypothetical protein
MLYHSKSGKEFVGLRVKANGIHQVVYDAQSGVRVLVDIKDHKANLLAIDDALREGVNARNVLSGVLIGLKNRNIQFDLPV